MSLVKIHISRTCFLLFLALPSLAIRNERSTVLTSDGSMINTSPMYNQSDVLVTDAEDVGIHQIRSTHKDVDIQQIRSAHKGDESSMPHRDDKHKSRYTSRRTKNIALEQSLNEANHSEYVSWEILLMPFVVVVFVVVAFYATRRWRKQRKMQKSGEIGLDPNSTDHPTEQSHGDNSNDSGQGNEARESIKSDDSFDRDMRKSMAQVIGPEDADIALWAPQDSTIVEQTIIEPDVAPTVFERFGSTILFSGTLVAFVILNVMDLICRQLASKDGGRQYSIYSVLIVANLLSIIIGNIVTYSQEGANGIKEAWDLKHMSKFAVSSVAFNCMSLLKFVAIDFGMQSDTIMLINRLSVVVLAVVMALILKKSQTKMQWALLITTTLAVILFVRLKDGLKDPQNVSNTEQEEGFTFREQLALLAAVGAMLCDVTGAATESAVYLWCEPKAMYIQKTHLDFPGMVCFIVWIFADPSERTKLLSKGFFHGWNMWVVIVSILFLSKMWCSSYIIKVLGPVVKQVASISGMVLTYFTVMVMFPEKRENRFDLNVCICVIVVALCVADYAIATREAGKEAARKKAEAAKAEK